MKREVRIIAVSLLLVACDEGKDSGGVDCTADARYSVTITVTDEEGASIPEAEVSYTVDGGEPAACEALEDAYFVCGIEQEGDFVITASAEGFVEEVLETTVLADECHVIPQSFTMELEGLECTAEVVPAAQITVTDGAGMPIETAEVALLGDDRVIACQSGEDAWSHIYTCMEEVYGDIILSVTHPDYEAHEEVIVVESDAAGCHPVTEEVAVTLSTVEAGG